MQKKYVGFVVLLLGLSYCNALQDELSYLAYTLNDLARLLPEAVPGGGDGGPGGNRKPGGKLTPFKGAVVGKVVGEDPALPARVVAFTSPDGDVMQRKVIGAENIDRPVGLSGYISVYYAFSELARSLTGKDIDITFDQFKVLAVRIIKKRRIEKVVREHLSDLLKNSGQFLLPIQSLPERGTLSFKSLSPAAIRYFYSEVLGAVASVEAEKYVKARYEEAQKEMIEEDKLKKTVTPYTIRGSELITEFEKVLKPIIDVQANKVKAAGGKPVISPEEAKSLSDDEIAYLTEIREVLKKPSDLQRVTINMIDPTTLKDFTGIDKTIKIPIMPEKILTELHDNNAFLFPPTPKKDERPIDRSYASEEGGGGDAMPHGLVLRSQEVEDLLKNQTLLDKVGLTAKQIEDSVTVLEAFNVLAMKNLAGLGFNALEQRQGNQILLQGKAEDKAARGKIQIFIVNADYDYRNPNAAPNWVTITRYPNAQYVVVDVKNEDRSNDVNVQLIKEAFGDV